MGIRADAVDRIIKKTLNVLERSKYQIFEICENAVTERDSLKSELVRVKEELETTIQNVDQLEAHYRLARIRLVDVSRNFHRYKEEDIRNAYEAASQLQLELIEPDEHPSTWREYLDEHGEGVHHIAFFVKGMKEKIELMGSQGMPLVQYGKYTGGRYAYMDTFPQLKVMLELLEND